MIRPGLSKISNDESHKSHKDLVEWNKHSEYPKSKRMDEGLVETESKEFVFQDPELYAKYVR